LKTGEVEINVKCKSGPVKAAPTLDEHVEVRKYSTEIPL
jgi:hypothetical protein